MKLKELEKRLKHEPDNLGLRVQVAGLMREAGRSVEAVELYRSVALAYRDQGRAQQAIAVCRSILEIAPEDSACQGLLAMLQQRGTPSRPPPVHEAPPPVAPAVPMRGSPMPPAPEVPSLRPITKPPENRPLTKQEPPADLQRRSSLDETPLPRPVPYHVVDPTSQPQKVSLGDLERETDPRPGERADTAGLAQAARRISGLISDRRGLPPEVDLSAELDTRERPKIRSEELNKIDQPPPTVPIDRVDALDDMTTPPPRDLDLSADSVEELTPPPRGSDDAITPPPLTGKPAPGSQPVPPRPSSPSLPRIGPPVGRTPTKPPAVVSIPPKTPSRPPGTMTPVGSPVTKLRPPAPNQPEPPARPAMPSIRRDSEEELTQPRDRADLDDDDD